MSKITAEAIAGFASMFGFVPAETVANDTQATLQYGQNKVIVNPDDSVNASEAFDQVKDDLSLDTTGFVNFSRNGNVIAGSAPIEAGGYYIATTKHDDKG